jgi:hypothetical protein
MKVIDIINEVDPGAKSGIGYMWNRAKHMMPVVGAGVANAGNTAYITARNTAADALSKAMIERELTTGKDVVKNKVRSKDPTTGKRVITQLMTKEEIDNIIKQSLNGLAEVVKADGSKQLVQIGSAEHTVVVKKLVPQTTPTKPQPPRKLGRRPAEPEELPGNYEYVDVPWNSKEVPADVKRDIMEKMKDRNYTLDNPKLFAKLRKEAVEQAENKVEANRSVIRDAETERLTTEVARRHEFSINAAKATVEISAIVGTAWAGLDIYKDLMAPYDLYITKMKAFDRWLDVKEVPPDYRWNGYTGSQKDVYSWYLEVERQEKAALIVRVGAVFAATAWTIPALFGFFKLFSWIGGKSFQAVLIQNALKVTSIAVVVKLITQYSQDIAATLVDWVFLGFKPVETMGGWFSTMNDRVLEINKVEKPSTTPNWKKQTGNEPPANNTETPPVPANNTETPPVPVNNTETPAKSIWDKYPAKN